MYEKLKQITSLRDLSDLEPEKALRRKILNIMLLVVAGINLIMILILAVVIPLDLAGKSAEVLRLIISVGIILLGSGGIYIISRRGYNDLASVILLLLLIVVIPISAEPGHIVDGRGLIYFVIPILISSFILRPWMSFVIAAASSVIITVLGLLVVKQQMPNIPGMLGFFVLAMVSWLSDHSLEKALKNLHKSDQRLRKNKEKLRSILESSPDAIAVTDLNSTILDCNPATLRLFGFEECEELVGKNALEFIAKSDRQKAANNIKKTLREGVSQNIEYTLIRKDGSRFPGELSAGIVTDTAGKATGFVAVIKDITERRGQEQIQRILYQISNAAHNTPSITQLSAVIQQKLSTFMDTKNFFLALYNKENDTISLPYFDDEKDRFKTFPAGKTCTAYVIRNAKPFLATDQKIKEMVATGELDIIGTLCKVWLGVPLKVGDEIIGLVGVQSYTDRNAYGDREREVLEFVASQIGLFLKHKQAEIELRESENRYRTIFENTGVATVIIEEDTTLSFVNRQFERLSGFQKSEIEHNKSWTEFVVQEDLERMQSYHTLRRENPVEAPNQYEFRFQDRDGETKHILLTVAVIPGTKKSVASLSDVSDQRRLEEQLKQAQKLEALGQLTGGVAHDFNNLLTVIQGNAELLDMEDDITQAQSALVHQILNAAQRAARMTKQLLLFSRKETMVFTSLDLNQTIGELLKMLKRLIGEDVVIKTDLTENIWTIEGDEGNLEQVIMNLAVNARDAMPKGGELILKTENIELSNDEAQGIPDAKAGRAVRLVLKDTGVGMEKGILDRIFDPFFSTKQQGKGTGLGLSVVYGIVKKHDGWITVDSEKGVGTTFNLYFPVASVPVAEQDEQQVSLKQLRGDNETILLIEDDPAVCKFGKAVLNHYGYQVDDVSDAAGALEIFKKNNGNYDLIISDVVLPDINGLELIDELHAIKSNIPVIMSSGYTEEKSKRKIIEERHYPFIEKPFNIEKMLTAVKETLGKSD